MMEDEHDTSALKSHRHKKSSLSITSCFHLRSSSGGHPDSFNVSTSSAPSPNYGRSPSSWFKSTKQRCHELPDMIKLPKRRNLMYRMGRHRRHASADFHYDPLSYALNFADDEVVAEVDHDHHHNFSSRLPVTPPRTRPVDDMAAGFDAIELREKISRVTTRRDAQAGELRNNVFEVRTPRSKADPSGKSPRSPSKEGRRNVEVSSPRVAPEILVKTC